MSRANRYKPVTSVRYAKILAGQPAFIKRKRSRGRFAVGVKYELQVHEYLELLVLGRANLEYRKKLWIEFADGDGTRRWCELDGLLIDRSQNVLVIYEIKYQHTADAWWQLTHLYEPVIRKLFPEFTICRMEVVHWHDPQIYFPERYELTESPLRVPKANKIAVCIYNPRRQQRDAGLSAPGHRDGQGGGETPSRTGPEGGADGSDVASSQRGGAVVHG